MSIWPDISFVNYRIRFNLLVLPLLFGADVLLHTDTGADLHAR